MDYVLVGRWAAALHDSPIIDGPRLIEVVPAVDEQNTQALAAALTSIAAAYDTEHDPRAGSLTPGSPGACPQRHRRLPATKGHLRLRRPRTRTRPG